MNERKERRRNENTPKRKRKRERERGIAVTKMSRTTGQTPSLGSEIQLVETSGPAVD